MRMPDEAKPARSALARHRATGDAWWETAISRVEPNLIEIRGYPIDELIGRLTYTEVLALLVLGRRLSAGEVGLLDAALVAGVDHGPRAPSIAAARMAATCGVSFNSAVATGINMLGDHHGGAVEQFMDLLGKLAGDATGDVSALAPAVAQAVDDYRGRRTAVPGYGHQLHDRDPRRGRMLELLGAAEADGTIGGGFLRVALAVEDALRAAVGRDVPLNVDGLSGIVYLELGFPAAVAKGLFSLSRGAGIVAHALEERQRGSLIKGPCPPGDDLVRYIGEPTRSLAAPAQPDD
jgi:citrate synthase